MTGTAESMAEPTIDLIRDVLSADDLTGLHVVGPFEVATAENAQDVIYAVPSQLDDDGASSSIALFRDPGYTLYKNERPTIDAQVGTVDVDAFNAVVIMLAQLGVVTLGSGWPG